MFVRVAQIKGSLCENSECRVQWIHSKDRLVCLRAVHCQPTLTCELLVLFGHGFSKKIVKYSLEVEC